MFTSADKAIAAAILGILSLITLWWGNHGLEWITEEWILGVLAVITPIIVFLVPNRPAAARLVHRDPGTGLGTPRD